MGGWSGAYNLTGGHSERQGGPVGVFEGVPGPQGDLHGLVEAGGGIAVGQGFRKNLFFSGSPCQLIRMMLDEGQLNWYC
jgi:hypothetical protein